MPVVGPLVVSPIKGLFSFAQMIGGLAVGIIFGIGATVADALGAKRMRDALGEVALNGFFHACKGFGSLLYASANLATLGIVGAVGEAIRSRCSPIENRHFVWIGA